MTLSTDFARTGQGLEYTLKELLRLGWVQFRRNLGVAIGYCMLVWLLTVAIGAAFLIATVLLCLGLLWFLEVVLGVNGTIAGWTVGVAVGVPAFFAFQVLVLPLYHGYLWAVARSYECGRMAWSDVTRGWRTPWREPLMRFNLALTLLYLAILVPVQGGLLIFSSAPHDWLPTLLVALVPVFLGLVGSALGGAISLASLLIGPIIFSSSQPSFIPAAREYFRMLKNQPRRLIIVAAIPAVVALAISLPGHTVRLIHALAPSSAIAVTGIGAICCSLAGFLAYSAFAIYYTFVIAACYRAAFGLPMAPQPAVILATSGDFPTNLRPARRHVSCSSADPPAQTTAAKEEPRP